jgi:hypothetical protein
VKDVCVPRGDPASTKFGVVQSSVITPLIGFDPSCSISAATLE